MDPTVLSDGFVYENDAISRWLRDNDRAPCTNMKLAHKHTLRIAPLAEALQIFLALQSAGPDKDNSLPARLRRATSAAENARIQAESKDSEEASYMECGPSTQRSLLEALEICIAEGDAEVVQCQASLSQARRVAKEMHHSLSASRFERNVKSLLGSSKWAEKRAKCAAEKQARIMAEEQEKQARAVAEQEARRAAAEQASKDEAAARIQMAWRLAKRWRARYVSRICKQAMRQRLRQSRVHHRPAASPVKNKFAARSQGLRGQAAAPGSAALIDLLEAGQDINWGGNAACFWQGWTREPPPQPPERQAPGDLAQEGLDMPVGRWICNSNADGFEMRGPVSRCPDPSRPRVRIGEPATSVHGSRVR